MFSHFPHWSAIGAPISEATAAALADALEAVKNTDAAKAMFVNGQAPADLLQVLNGTSGLPDDSPCPLRGLLLS